MSASGVENQDGAGDKWDLTQIPVTVCVSAIWARRRWLSVVIACGAFITLGIAFLFPNEYTSTAQLMPLDPQAFSNASVLSPLSGAAGLLGSSVAGGLMNQKTPGGTAIGVLSSPTVEDDIINRFDLRHAYHLKLYRDTRKMLAGNSVFDEDKKSGILTISVTDHDRYRARDMAQAYVEELNKLVNSLSTSSARRERIFLEERLSSIKASLDASSHTLSQFSSRNATVDPQKEGEATVEAVEKLQEQLIAAQGQLSGLRARYADDNVQVRQVRAQISELQGQIHKMSGLGENTNATDLKSDQVLPSVRQLPLLGYTYYDLYRQVTMQETLYETLTKQYEFAKVQEAKEIPPIKVLDEPAVPEAKSSPHRLTITLLGALLSAFAGISWIVTKKLWELIDKSHPSKLFVANLRNSFRDKTPTTAP
jgi:capsule polysaccharide export protein KpsE/RkpR